jgi:hypothetical protein
MRGRATNGEVELEQLFEQRDGATLRAARKQADPHPMKRPTTFLQRATRLNRRRARLLGWRLYIDRIVRLLGFATSTPNERIFAEAVARWQTKQGLPADGVIGPNTWARMRLALGLGTNGQSSGSYIQLNPRARLTAPIARAVGQLEPYFRNANLPVRLTSGYRSPQDQLELIKGKAIKYGLDKKYPSIQTATVDDVESWHSAWDELLHNYGYITNPPVSAVSRITGKRYGASPHSTGKAFDLSGADLNRIAAVVQRYKKDGGSIGQIRIEPVNHAVHIGIQ